MLVKFTQKTLMRECGYARYLILFFYLLISSSNGVLGQAIFSPGMVITASGDTLQGEVGEFGSNKNYQECHFRAAPGAKVQVFTPAQIQSYCIENRRCFESRRLENANENNAFVFAEWIVEGGTSLLKIKKEFYVLYDGVDTLQRVSLEGTIATRRDWLRFLNTLGQNCLSLKYHYGNSKNLEAKEKNLIEIIKLYNDCQGTSYKELGAGLPIIAVKAGVSVAFDYTRLDFESTTVNTYSYLVEPSYASLGPTFGVGMLVSSPRRLSTFGLYIEPSIRAYHLEADLRTKETNTSAEEAYYHTAINWLGLGSPFTIRYTIPNRKPQISFQAGPFLQLLLQTKAATTEELVIEEFLSDRDIITTNRFTPLEFSKYQLGLVGQVNLRTRWNNLPGAWEIALGFQRGGGIVLEDTFSVSGRLKSSTTSFFLKAVWYW